MIHGSRDASANADTSLPGAAIRHLFPDVSQPLGKVPSLSPILQWFSPPLSLFSLSFSLSFKATVLSLRFKETALSMRREKRERRGEGRRGEKEKGFKHIFASNVNVQFDEKMESGIRFSSSKSRNN